MKRITIQIDNKLHTEVKIRSAEKNLSIKDWILIAISDLMVKEDALNKGVLNDQKL